MAPNPSESSQNSQTPRQIGNFDVKQKKRSLLGNSEFRESSQNSWKRPCVKITEHEDVREITLPLKPEQLQKLQKNDTYCREVARKLHKDIELQKIFIKEKGVLYRL